MRKILKILLFLVLLAIPVLFIIGYTPDLDPADLRAKYANGESEFALLPSGANVHYRDQGNAAGPAILLVHGSNSSLHTWEPVVALQGSFRRGLRCAADADTIPTAAAGAAGARGWR